MINTHSSTAEKKHTELVDVKKSLRERLMQPVTLRSVFTAAGFCWKLYRVLPIVKDFIVKALEHLQ